MKISVKEREVLALVAWGNSDKEIASKLGIGYGTVRTYISRIVFKLNARNKVHAAILYSEIEPNWLKRINKK